jgi:hypothetical protein
MFRVTWSATWKGIAVGCLVLGAAGSATAQQPGGGRPAQDAQVGFERRAQLSPQEELTQAEVAASRMEQAATTVRHQLEAARIARDVVKTLCLNDKLSQIDVASRSARDRQSTLQAAVQRGDIEMGNHEFTVLTVLRQRAEQLSAEANQCIGEEVAFVGQTQVTTSIDPTLPGTDTTSFPSTDPTLISAPPGCVSCTGGM